MILEGILTTVNADGSVNIAPMGPIVDESMTTLRLRPFQTAVTFANLQRTGQGVFHVIDDVLLLAHAAVGNVDPLPALTRAEKVDGWIINDACRWYAVRVRELDDSRPRAEITADVVDSGQLHEWFGFNRARHAVLEAAILATRVNLLSMDEILQDFEKFQIIVDKTGGPREKEAFEFLVRYVREAQPSLNRVDMTG